MSSTSSPSSTNDNNSSIHESRDTHHSLVSNDNNGLSKAEQIYRSSNSSRKMLGILCIGIMDDSDPPHPLMDIDAFPWSEVKPKSFIKPKVQELHREVHRRAVVFEVHPLPRPKGWNAEKTIEWLKNNPISDERDCQFLVSEVRSVRNTIEMALKEAAEDEQKLKQFGAWRDKVPYLRMIHCIIEDDVKMAYLKRNDPISRSELDARNSVEKRPPTAYELIADKWNSASFNPVTFTTDCHIDYMSPINCSFEEVKDLSPATPQKVQDKLTEMRTNLIRIIDNWERSGQGDGGYDDNAIEDGAEEGGMVAIQQSEHTQSPYGYGELKNRPSRALDTRSSFLLNRPSYLLYLWEVFEQHGLLSTTVNRLSNNVAVADGEVESMPLVSGGSVRKKRRQDKESVRIGAMSEVLGDESCFRSMSSMEDTKEDMNDIAFVDAVMTGLDNSLSKESAKTDARFYRNHLNFLYAEKRKYRMLEATHLTTDAGLAEFYRDEGMSIDDEIKTNKEKLEKLEEVLEKTE